MCQKLLEDASLYKILQKIDKDIAAKAKAKRCPYCGGDLHCADYPRKPRGGPAANWPEYQKRFSFCCANEECRKRTTPESVRFLGRKVYLSAVIVLVSIFAHGLKPQRFAQLRQWIEVDRNTLKRWLSWWRETLPRTKFWKSIGGLFEKIPEIKTLPKSLWEKFDGDDQKRLVSLLEVVAPVT